MMNPLPAPLSFCSIRIRYSGPPGQVEGEVTSLESKGNFLVDSLVQNAANGWAVTSANPWHLDEDTESILFLGNESE
jgi:hypothetical protein